MIWFRPRSLEHLTRRGWFETARKFAHIDGPWNSAFCEHFSTVRLLPAANDRDHLRW